MALTSLGNAYAMCHSGRLRLKMQKIHRVNLVQLNLLKSREIIERHWICPRRNRPGLYKKKIWRRLRERLSRAARRRDEDSLEIHSPAVESIHSHWIDSIWFSSFIERPWIDSTDSSLIEGAQWSQQQNKMEPASHGKAIMTYATCPWSRIVVVITTKWSLQTQTLREQSPSVRRRLTLLNDAVDWPWHCWEAVAV